MSQVKKDVYIVSAVRTPVAKARGAFQYVRPDDLLSHVLVQLNAKTDGLNPARVGDVIIGCAMPEGEQGMNVARIASLMAGIPESVPAMTVNRFCSSGLQAIALAADKIALGEEDVMIAGGVESMTRVPMGGYKFSANPRWFSQQDEHIAIAYGMGITAEKVAEQWKISRESQDEFSLNSHKKAIQAIEAGEFRQEIAPYTVHENLPNLANGELKRREILVEHDEGPRAGSNIETLARLRTVFSRNGTVTAASSSQMSDGAAALLLASEEAVKQHQWQPLAKFKAFAVAGCPPEVMGIGPKYAIPKALERAGLTLDKLEWIELNEAFAAQSLAVINDVGLDPEIVNPLGGAIALGHPLGATGAIKATTLVHGLRRHQKKYGMVTMCIGTGMGAAGIFEACT